MKTGLIWVSGVRRYLSATSQIGFHAAYREENGEYKESGVANAEIGSYLTHLGLRPLAMKQLVPDTDLKALVSSLRHDHIKELGSLVPGRVRPSDR